RLAHVERRVGLGAEHDVERPDRPAGVAPRRLRRQAMGEEPEQQPGPEPRTLPPHSPLPHGDLLPLGLPGLTLTGRPRGSARLGTGAGSRRGAEADPRRHALTLVELEVGPLAVAGRRRDPERRDAPHQGVPVAYHGVVVAPSILEVVLD